MQYSILITLMFMWNDPDAFGVKVLYKLLVLTYRALEGKGPSYLWDIIELCTPKTSVVLRSDGLLSTLE